MKIEIKIDRGGEEAFFNVERYLARLDMKRILDTFAEVSREVLITETQAGRFANGSNFNYSGSARKRKYAKRGSRDLPDSENDLPHSEKFTGYKGFRDAKGLQVDFVDFTFTGQTLRNILTNIDLDAALFMLIIEGDGAIITKGLKEYYDWFSFQSREEIILQKTVAALDSKDLFE